MVESVASSLRDPLLTESDVENVVIEQPLVQIKSPAPGAPPYFRFQLTSVTLPPTLPPLLQASISSETWAEFWPKLGPLIGTLDQVNNSIIPALCTQYLCIFLMASFVCVFFYRDMGVSISRFMTGTVVFPIVLLWVMFPRARLREARQMILVAIEELCGTASPSLFLEPSDYGVLECKLLPGNFLRSDLYLFIYPKETEHAEFDVDKGLFRQPVTINTDNEEEDRGGGQRGPQQMMLVMDEEREALNRPVIINTADVLCGRGKVSFNHEGNKRFRDMVSAALEDYIKAESRFEKSIIVHGIVDQIHKEGGRFLKKNSGSVQWHELSHQRSKEKVGHAVRDAANLHEDKLKKDLAIGSGGHVDALGGLASSKHMDVASMPSADLSSRVDENEDFLAAMDSVLGPLQPDPDFRPNLQLKNQIQLLQERIQEQSRQRMEDPEDNAGGDPSGGPPRHP